MGDSLLSFIQFDHNFLPSIMPDKLMFYFYLGYPDILLFFLTPCFVYISSVLWIKELPLICIFRIPLSDIMWLAVAFTVSSNASALTSWIVGGGAALASLRSPLILSWSGAWNTVYFAYESSVWATLGDDVITGMWRSVVPRCSTRLWQLKAWAI